MRADIETGHKLYRAAAYAWLHQDSWSLDEHRDFWTGLLDLWPHKKGLRNQRDVLATAVAALDGAGLPPDAVAAHVGIDPDSIRRMKYRERGEELTANVDHAASPLPRVYDAFGEEPPRSQVTIDVARELTAAPIIEAAVSRSPHIALVLKHEPYENGQPEIRLRLRHPERSLYSISLDGGPAELIRVSRLDFITTSKKTALRLIEENGGNDAVYFVADASQVNRKIAS